MSIPSERASLNAHCIDWTGSSDTEGYGRFGRNGRKSKAHRWAYEKFFGPIPAGLLVMHSCDRPACINPLHLSVGTDRDNMRDAASKGRTRNQKKTACPQGHSYTLDNLVRSQLARRGRRHCLQCTREAFRRYIASEAGRASRLRSNATRRDKQAQERADRLSGEVRA